MCCFSGPVSEVADTGIFARSVDGWQFLAYHMTYATIGEIAMVLPLPVPPNPGDGAVRFINLEKYPTFFEALDSGFIAWHTLDLTKLLGSPPVGPQKLRVHQVGSFEASFVPHLQAFDRLDKRFRIPSDVWNQLPKYDDYGFAVFKLNKTAAAGRILRHRLHPMAFRFRQRTPERLYFPTVHIHDGHFHAEAHFDHALFYQSSAPIHHKRDYWERSEHRASHFVNVGHAAEVVAADQYCWRTFLMGPRENIDVWLGGDSRLPSGDEIRL